MIPSSVDEVSAQFVTSALGLPATAVTHCLVRPVTGERGMSGSLVRLQLEGQAPEVPESLIGKLPPGDAAQRALLDAMKFFEREVSFYRTLAAATPVDTPRCYFADIDPGTGHAFLLLEDLAPARNGGRRLRGRGHLRATRSCADARSMVAGPHSRRAVVDPIAFDAGSQRAGGGVRASVALVRRQAESLRR